MIICSHLHDGRCMLESNRRPSPGYCLLICRRCEVGSALPEQELPVAKPMRMQPPRDVAELLPTEDERAFDAAIATGLGEEIHALAVRIGAEKFAKLWERFTGKTCGCHSRRKRLNAMFPGGWRQLFSGTGRD